MYFLYEKDYRELADTLSIPIDNKDILENLVIKVHRKLENMHFDNKPWLLIFDNLEEEKRLPRRGGVVLITTYYMNFYRSDKTHLLPLTPFTEMEAAAFFPKASQNELIELTQAFEGFPVLFTLAKQYCKQ